MLLFSFDESGKFKLSENKYAESSRKGVNYSLLIKDKGLPEPVKVNKKK